MNKTRENAMERKMACILMVSAMVLPTRGGSADVPAVTAASAQEIVRMQRMHWLATRSAEQAGEVRSALTSGHPMVVEPALDNVILHRLVELAPIIRQGVGPPKTAARDFADICGQALELGGDPFERLRQALRTELPGDEFIPVCDKLDYCRPVRHMVTSLIVLHEIRMVRAGEKKQPGLEGMDLLPVEAALVRFSALQPTAAINAILDELSKARVASTRERTLIEVLHTYPEATYLPMAIEKLEQSVGTEGYGTHLLLDSLKGRLDGLDIAAKARLHAIFASIRRSGCGASLNVLLTTLEAESQ